MNRSDAETQRKSVEISSQNSLEFFCVSIRCVETRCKWQWIVNLEPTHGLWTPLIGKSLT